MKPAKHRLPAILLLHCSHCLQSPVFYGLFKMFEICPVCGIRHEREQGFFTMAIFIGYCFYFAILLPLTFWLYWLGLPLWQIMVAIVITSLVLIIPVFHYARVVWLHIDEVLSPRL
jgi:uncharacterized protein (DUF983 family)